MRLCIHCRERKRKARLKQLADAAMPTLNMDQAVQQSGVSRRTLYYWMRIGRLPFVVVDGHRRVRLKDILTGPIYQRWSIACKDTHDLEKNAATRATRFATQSATRPDNYVEGIY